MRLALTGCILPVMAVMVRSGCPGTCCCTTTSLSSPVMSSLPLTKMRRFSMSSTNIPGMILAVGRSSPTSSMRFLAI